MATISLRSINFSDRFVRHANFLGELTPIVSELDKNDATSEIVQGLADDRFISFRSVNFPGYYLRHQDFRLKLQESNPPLGGTHDRLFAEDATFFWRPGNSDVTASSFACFNFPNRFIRHREFHLFIEPLGDAISFQDSTFKIEPGLIPPPAPPVVN
jgi:hypothetical protein